MPPRRSRALVSWFVATPLWSAWAVSSSLALHAVAYVGLGDGKARLSPRPPKSAVAFEVAAPPPKVEEPAEAPKVEPPEPVARTPPLAGKPHEPRSPAPEPPPEVRNAAAPLDMSGLTLTNDLGVGFAMPSGNGLAREGALRVPASLSRGVPVETQPQQPAATGPRLVAVKDLSSRPTPPALGGALERNYPPDARRRGLGGSAMVRIRIDADGLVRTVTALDESSPGFGEACRRTLRGSRWSAPRDKEGHAVATEVRYTCRFVVNP